MVKLVPFNKFSNNKILSSAGFSVVMENKVPVGFVIERDAFITFLEKIDEEFEKKVVDPNEAFDNPAGRLIDLIEERLPVKSEFAESMKGSIKKKRSKFISLEEVAQALHV